MMSIVSRLQRIVILVPVLFSLSASAAWAAPESFQQGRFGGTLVLATTSDPKTFNEIVAQETSSSLVTGYIFEGLTTVNALTLEVEPQLAKRWTVSPNGKVWTFFLRHDVRWNDGVPFTADDVVFTFNRLIYNDKIPSSARDIFTVDGKKFKVEKLGRYTVRFTLPVKFAPFLRSLSQPILPQHKLAAAVRNGRFTFTWGIDTPPNEIVGTGPFKLAEYHPGERLVFVRNPFYWKKAPDGRRLPYLDRIIYLIVQNQDVTVMKFLDGELDACSVRGMDYPLLKPLEKKKNFTIYNTGPDFGSNFIAFNQNPRIDPQTGRTYIPAYKLKWFTNLQFRRAVAHAIDKQKMIEILDNGLGYPQAGPLSPSAGFFYDPHVVRYDYNLKEAARILKGAGFVKRGGTLYGPDGHKVEFNLYTNASSVQRVQIAAIIRHDLESLGMQVNFLALEFNTLVTKINSTFDWDAVLLGLTGGVEPHFGKNVWDSAGQLHLWDPREKRPATPWEARVDAIFDEGVQELNKNKRKALYDQWQVIASRQLPMIYTILGSNMFAVRNRFGNLHPTSYGGAFHNIEEIYIKPPLSKR